MTDNYPLYPSSHLEGKTPWHSLDPLANKPTAMCRKKTGYLPSTTTEYYDWDAMRAANGYACPDCYRAITRDIGNNSGNRWRVA